MKKTLIICSFIFLIAACSKNQPKEDMKAEIVTSSVSEPEQVAGASYLPDFKEEIEDDLSEIATPEETPQIKEAEEPVSTAEPAPKKVYRPKAKPAPKEEVVIPEPHEEEIIVAMEENLKEKIEADEDITKEVITPEPVVQEEPRGEKKSPMGLMGLLALAVVSGAGYFMKKKKHSDDDDEK